MICCFCIGSDSSFIFWRACFILLWPHSFLYGSVLFRWYKYDIPLSCRNVRFTQQLVLFAPQALSVHSHVQTLLPTLSSRQVLFFGVSDVLFAPFPPFRSHIIYFPIWMCDWSLWQPTLRHLAISTLRHLIEKDSVSFEDDFDKCWRFAVYKPSLQYISQVCRIYFIVEFDMERRMLIANP